MTYSIETNIGIFAGLLLGGFISMCIAAFNGSIATALVGEMSVIIGVVWFVGVAISFNTGTHVRRT